MDNIHNKLSFFQKSLSTNKILQTLFELTIVAGTEGVLVVFLKVRRGAAPELSIIASLRCAGVKGFPHEHKRKNTRLAT